MFIYIGYPKEPVSYETRFFVQKELDMGSRNATTEDFREVIAMLKQGAFPVKGTISRIVPLSEAGSVIKQWSANPRSFSKILVRLDG